MSKESCDVECEHSAFFSFGRSLVLWKMEFIYGCSEIRWEFGILNSDVVED
jgi:hypothetical protein